MESREYIVSPKPDKRIIERIIAPYQTLFALLAATCIFSVMYILHKEFDENIRLWIDSRANSPLGLIATFILFFSSGLLFSRQLLNRLKNHYKPQIEENDFNIRHRAIGLVMTYLSFLFCGLFFTLILATESPEYRYIRAIPLSFLAGCCIYLTVGEGPYQNNIYTLMKLFSKEKKKIDNV